MLINFSKLSRTALLLTEYLENLANLEDEIKGTILLEHKNVEDVYIEVGYNLNHLCFEAKLDFIYDHRICDYDDASYYTYVRANAYLESMLGGEWLVEKTRQFLTVLPNSDNIRVDVELDYYSTDCYEFYLVRSAEKVLTVEDIADMLDNIRHPVLLEKIKEKFDVKSQTIDILGYDEPINLSYQTTVTT